MMILKDLRFQNKWVKNEDPIPQLGAGFRLAQSSQNLRPTKENEKVKAYFFINIGQLHRIYNTIENSH